MNVAVQTNVNVGARQFAERLIQNSTDEPELKAQIAQALGRLMMNKAREAAYRIVPVLWVREILGVNGGPMAGDVFTGGTRGIHSCPDGAASRQDHHRGVGDRTFHAVYARLVVCDCLSGAAPECGSGAAGAERLSSRRAPSSKATTFTRWS